MHALFWYVTNLCKQATFVWQPLGCTWSQNLNIKPQPPLHVQQLLSTDMVPRATSKQATSIQQPFHGLVIAIGSNLYKQVTSAEL